MEEPLAPAQIATDLREARRGEGMTLSVIQSSPTLSRLRVSPAPLPDGSVSGQAVAVLASIHAFLHQRRGERIHRSAAMALNIDSSGAWTGGLVTALADSNLGGRRNRVAEIEGVNNNGGRPMSDWENEAFDLLAEELASNHSDSSDNNAADAATADVNQRTEWPGAAAAVSPERDLADRQSVRSNASSQWRVIVGVAVALVLALWIGIQVSGNDDPVDVGTTGADTTQGAVAVQDLDASTEAVDVPTSTSVTPVTETSAPTATSLPEPTPEPPPTSTPVPVANPEPTTPPTPEPTPSPEPTFAPTPTAIPLANAVSGFDLEIVNFEMDEETVRNPKSVSLGGVDFALSVNWGTNGRGTFHRSDRFFVEFPAGREFDCFQTVLGLANKTDADQPATFQVVIDGDLHEERVLTKFDQWTVSLTGLGDVGFVEVSWQFSSTDREGYGVVADPVFYRTCQ